MHSWYLEGYFDANSALQKQPIKQLPQTLGRDSALDCAIQGATISRRHALLALQNNQLCIRDLDSRNGTFVNRERITLPTLIAHGDVIHLGDVELRVIDALHAQNTSLQNQDSDETCIVSIEALSQHFPSGINDLETLIEKREILPVFQPIIRASDLTRTGFELLSRGQNAQLPVNPIELYRLAESFSLQVTLSELMRDVGIAAAAHARVNSELLVNTHPSEMADIDRLLASIHGVKNRYPSMQLALEIHEQAITDDISVLKTLQSELNRLDMRLAFDDFGVGQSRLVEMVEAKPDLIKFDRVLIANIDSAEPSRVNLVKHLLSLANELNIDTLAEGVGTEGEFRCSEELGFLYYQGFHFSRPYPLSHFQDITDTQEIRSDKGD